VDGVLGYSGRRCIVTGAASGTGEATTRILVELGAEVHTVDTRKPDIVGIASFSETDLLDPAAVARTVDAIGAVVNNLFNCSRTPGDAVVEVTERVIPNMIDGAAIASLADDASGEVVATYTARRAVELIELGIRINCCGSDAAWPLVLLGSPRSSPVTGARL
jgi:NAD(P)-dependent dehydrogenase (short-subunit alcohol dehydrogenase family)